MEEAASDRPHARPPRFNHVAMSVSVDLLQGDGRASILDFYGEVFGWEEAPGMSVDGEQLVLLAHRYDQFVFLIADEQPMAAPRMDHFGQSVSSIDELTELYHRAEAYRQRDERVDLVAPHADTYPGVTLHSWYVGFLLPMMIETQFWEWTSEASRTNSGER